MATVSRVCAFVVAAAGVVAAPPVDAAMTLVFRDGGGKTGTYYQEGDRVRLIGDDAGEAIVVDLATKRHLVVYDDVKAYMNFDKAIARARAMAEQAMNAEERSPRQQPSPAVTYRVLGTTRTINGFACTMYERVVARRVEAEICFAPWGTGVGQPADFAWLDAFAAHMASALIGTNKRPAAPRSRDNEPGLAIWTSSLDDDGTRDVTEIVKVSRDPLPAALFTVPADYKEISRQLTATERVPRGSEPIEATWQGAAPPSRQGISGVVAILIAVILIFGLLVHSIVLHFVASLVIEHALFTQALVASIITWVVLIAAELLHLPPVIGLGVSIFTTFAALKIAYGASVPRTFALFALSALIAVAARYGAGHIGSLLGAR